MNNTKHYVDLFSEAVDKILPKPSREISYGIIGPRCATPALILMQVQRRRA
jgi:hypothetical protein